MVSSCPPPDFCRLRDALRTEVEAFALLRHRQGEGALLESSAAYLLSVVGQVASLVANPTQRYAFSREQQWGFVGLVAYVQEAKSELKQAQRCKGEKHNTPPRLVGEPYHIGRDTPQLQSPEQKATD